MEDFCSKLRTSGYSRPQIKDIVESGTVVYGRRRERQSGVKHRKCDDTKSEKLKKKLTGKTTLFKWKKKKIEIKSQSTQERKKDPCKLGKERKKMKRPQLEDNHQQSFLSQGQKEGTYLTF